MLPRNNFSPATLDPDGSSWTVTAGAILSVLLLPASTLLLLPHLQTVSGPLPNQHFAFHPPLYGSPPAEARSRFSAEDWGFYGLNPQIHGEGSSDQEVC